MIEFWSTILWRYILNLRHLDFIWHLSFVSDSPEFGNRNSEAFEITGS